MDEDRYCNLIPLRLINELNVNTKISLIVQGKGRQTSIDFVIVTWQIKIWGVQWYHQWMKKIQSKHNLDSS